MQLTVNADVGDMTQCLLGAGRAQPEDAMGLGTVW